MAALYTPRQLYRRHGNVSTAHAWGPGELSVPPGTFRAPQYLPAGWTPAVLGAKVVYWWIADPQYITLDGNGRVQQWDTKVGVASFVQATAGKRPLYEASRWNNRPCVNSDTTACNLRTSGTISITRPCTIAIAGSGSYGGALYELSDNAGSNATGGFWHIGSNAPALANLGPGGAGAWSIYNNTSGTMLDCQSTSIIPYGFPKTMLHQLGSTHATHSANVANLAWPITGSTTNNPGTSTSTGNLNIFSRGGGASLGSVARIAEIVIAQNLTATESMYLDAYLQNRYGLRRQCQQVWLGDSILANDGPSPTPVRKLVFPTDSSDCQVIDLSVFGYKLADEATNWAGPTGTPKGFSNIKLALTETGVNDIQNGASASTVLTAIQSQINSFIAAGIPEIVLVAISPTAAVNNTVRTAVNNGLSSLTGWTKIVSSHLAILDNGSGGCLPQYTIDGTHFSLAGEVVYAQAIRDDAMTPLGWAA